MGGRAGERWTSRRARPSAMSAWRSSRAASWRSSSRRRPAASPIERAGISIRSVAREQRFSGRTDATGVARVRLAPGDYELRRHLQERLHRSGAVRGVFTIVEGETKRLEQTLGSLPSVGGVVYDDAGKPVGWSSRARRAGLRRRGCGFGRPGEVQDQLGPAGLVPAGMVFYSSLVTRSEIWPWPSAWKSPAAGSK